MDSQSAAIGTARSHGVPDEDIHHAVQVVLRRVTTEEGVRISIGAARDGAPIEIGVLNPGTDETVIIHAMPLRPA